MTDQVDGPFSDEAVSSLRTDLKRFLEENDLDPTDCCLVGSVCLSIRDLREHGDIDVCVAPSHRDGVGEIGDLIELASNKYEHIGISDETIIYDETYHDDVEGIKIVRPEIEYSHKLYRQWEKDREDIALLDEYSQETHEWEPDLVVDDYTPSISHVATRGIRSLRRDGFKRTIEHGIEFTRRHGPLSRRSQDDYETKPTSIPARAVQSYRQAGLKKTVQRGIRLVKLADPTGLLQRYTKPRRKIKVGTLAEDELKLKYDPADFIAAQYSGAEFTRYDLVVYLLAIKEHRGDTRGGFDLYEKFEDHADVQPLGEFLDAVDEYFEQQDRPPVPIGYSSEILDPEIAACALYDSQQEVEVTVEKPDVGVKRCPIAWFESRDFTDAELAALRTEFSALLDEHGVLFEAIIWPPASDHFEEIVESLVEEERVHSCTRLTFDRETFGEFVHDLYATQTDVRWEYIEKKIERIGEEPSNILSVQIEVPDPRIRERNSHEMKEIKERYRARYNPQIAPDDPNTRRTIHATDDYAHNRETRDVLEEYEEKALSTHEIISRHKDALEEWEGMAVGERKILSYEKG